MQSFLAGMYYFILGFKSLAQQGLKRFVLMPILFNLILYIALVYLGFHYLSPFISYYIAKLPDWLSFLNGLFMVIFFILFFLFFLSTITVFTNILAAPFNGLLASRAQEILTKKMVPPQSFRRMVVQSIKRQRQFIFYYIPRFLLLCLLFFIPPLHPILPFIWFFFNAWMLSLQYQDFAFDNNLIDFPSTKTLIKKNKALAFGFGVSIAILSFIPFLNILIMPAAAIGGTLMFCDKKQQETVIKLT